ncbi:MAG: response regulator [Spirochaetia bacterium]
MDRKVVAVEDEKLELLGIRSLFANQKRYTLTGSFTNAEDALEFLQNNPPDILLSDIKMPGMDGLTLIKKVKEILPDIRIVVLSFFSDFQYVHKAFKLGIDDYILKHELEQDTLFQVFDKLSGTEAGDAVNRELEPEMPFEKLLHDHGSFSPAGLKSGTVVLWLLRFKKSYTREFKQKNQRIDLQMCRSIIQNIIDSVVDGYTFHDTDQQIIILLEGDSRFSGKRDRFLRELHQEMDNYFNQPHIIAKSTPFPQQNMKEAYTQTKSISAQGFYYHESVILDRDSTIRSPAPVSPLPPPELVFFHAADETEKIFETFFRHAEENKIPENDLRNEIILFWERVDVILQETFRIQLEEELFLFSQYEILKSIDDVDVMQEWMLRMFDKVQKQLSSLHLRNRLAGEISLYIRENFRDDITLSSLAEHFNINHTYLSEIFKKENGIGFSDFLNQVRIRKAQEIFLSGRHTSEEVCYLVGFHNPSHFSRVFKRITGMTAMDYRNRLMS